MPLCVMFLGQTFSASYIACKKQIVHVALHYIQYCFEFVLRPFKGGKKITSKKLSGPQWQYFCLFIGRLGTRWRSWLRHCATSRKVAGSISDGVTGIFHWHNPSGRTMALRLTQYVTEMIARNISWGVKAAGASGWQPYHLHMPIVWISGSLKLLEPSGPVQACNGIALSLTVTHRQVLGLLDHFSSQMYGRRTPNIVHQVQCFFFFIKHVATNHLIWQVVEAWFFFQRFAFLWTWRLAGF